MGSWLLPYQTHPDLASAVASGGAGRQSLSHDRQPLGSYLIPSIHPNEIETRGQRSGVQMLLGSPGLLPPGRERRNPLPQHVVDADLHLHRRGQCPAQGCARTSWVRKRGAQRKLRRRPRNHPDRVGEGRRAIEVNLAEAIGHCLRRKRDLTVDEPIGLRHRRRASPFNDADLGPPFFLSTSPTTPALHPEAGIVRFRARSPRQPDSCIDGRALERHQFKGSCRPGVENSLVLPLASVAVAITSSLSVTDANGVSVIVFGQGGLPHPS